MSSRREPIQGTAPVAVRFEHVTKRYRLYSSDAGRILSALPGMHERFVVGERLANDDLSFEIRRGEAVSFVGNNGAGKSTLLKMVAGVAYPNEGTVEVNGRVSALLEVTAGFDRQLTGRDNLRLRATAMGMSDAEIAAVEPGVIDFAELGVYIDQPLRTYSSGMRAPGFRTSCGYPARYSHHRRDACGGRQEL